jgi:hemoglobin-like flavoprotein
MRTSIGARQRPIDPDAVALVHRSFDAVEANARQATALFCRRLANVAPDVRVLLPHDLEARASEVIATVAPIIRHLADPDELTRLAGDLVRRVPAVALRPQHLEIVGGAIVWTLSTGLGHLFTPAHRDAWRAAYASVSTALVHAATSPPDRRVAAAPAAEPNARWHRAGW